MEVQDYKGLCFLFWKEEISSLGRVWVVVLGVVLKSVEGDGMSLVFQKNNFSANGKDLNKGRWHQEDKMRAESPISYRAQVHPKYPTLFPQHTQPQGTK